MAIFHLSAKVVSRSGGRSAVAAAAYRSGGVLRDERSGDEHNYSRKGGVVHAEILAPETAPDWMRDRSQLWNAVERVEKRKDAQLAREVEVSLPRELSRDARIDLLRAFVAEQFVARGMIADIAVHEGRARDGGGQPHAHVMLTMRNLTGEGFGPKNRDWNAPDILQDWRSAWAREANAALERAGFQERIDHRSLEIQREEAREAANRARVAGEASRAEQEEARAASLDREPQPKLGPFAAQLEKQGVASERGDELRAVEARNRFRQQARELQRELASQIAEMTRQALAHARERLDTLWRRAQAAYEAIRARLGVRDPAMLSEELGAMRDGAAKSRAAGEFGGSVERDREAAVLHDRLLGRALAKEPPQRDAAPAMDREALLGRRAPRAEPERQATPADRDRLLGRGGTPAMPERSADETREREPRDRGRGGGREA